MSINESLGLAAVSLLTQQSRSAKTDVMDTASTSGPEATSSKGIFCDDCEEPTDWVHAVQTDPWGRPTGDVYCENCAEKRWDRYQEYLMEIT